MPAIAAAIIGGGVALAGTAYSSSQASSAAAARNRQQMALTEQQMKWEEQMRSTAHQAEVEDLRKAGLNPILSGTGGAGASGHSVAPASVDSEYVPADYGGATNAAVSAYSAAKQQKLIEAQTSAANAAADKAGAEADQTRMVTENMLPEQVQSAREDIRLKNFEFAQRTRLSGDQAAQVRADADRAEQQLRRGEIDIDVAKQQLKNLVQEYKIGHSAEAQAKIIESIYKGDEGATLKWLGILKDLVPWGNVPRIGR